MAKKRAIEPKMEAERDEGDQQTAPSPQVTAWRIWLKETYARYWYVLGCFFLDIMAFTELWNHEETGQILPFAVLILLVVGETWLYLYIWPRKPSAQEELEEEDFL